MNLLNQLDTILELTEQINNITTNQTTVILESLQQESETDLDTFLEQMSEIKETLINETDQLELTFDADYKVHKELVATNKELAATLKSKITKLLELKKLILNNEKINMDLMKSAIARQNKVARLPQDLNKVIKAYKSNKL